MTVWSGAKRSRHPDSVPERINVNFDKLSRQQEKLEKFPSTRLAIDRSICILTRPVVNTGFNRSLLVDWWSIGQLKKPWSMLRYVALVIPILLDSINRLKIVSI